MKCKDSDRVSHYTPEKIKSTGIQIDFSNMDFPVQSQDFEIFELQNHKYSINVFDYDEKSDHSISPLYQTKGEKEIHTNILLIHDDDNNSHCVLIKNFSRLLSDGRINQDKLYYCLKCLHGYTREELLIAHKLDGCKAEVKEIFPTSEESIITFKNMNNKIKAAFIIYADFECLLTKIMNFGQNNNQSYTEKYQHHTP